MTEWTPEQAERYLREREFVGMRLGLERMRRLLTALEHPERRFESIHIVGTNGKSSTTRMIAAILEAHARAIARVARATELVDRSLEPDDRVTQFEILTAAGFWELARRAVEVAVIEAGIGGRFDATNVIDSRVQVLTNVGLEHTQWLGPTVTAIAGEKLDVVRPGGTLVLGAGLHPDADAVAERVARERGARIVRAGEDPGVSVAAPGAYQRRNFALARAAAEAFLGQLDPRALAAAAAAVRVPGRLQVIGSEPLTVLDGAHNPDGVAALLESLGELAAGRERLIIVISVLDDKDVGAMLANLVPLADAFVLTQSHSPRALSPAALQSAALERGARRAEIAPDPHEALALARALAGPGGMVLVTGSIYLLGDLLAAAPQAADARASVR